MKRVVAFLFFVCIVYFPIIVFAQSAECGTVELSDEEMEKFPYWGNNAYLSKLADSLKIFEPAPFYKGESAYVKNIPVSNYKVPIQFWIYRDNNGNDGGMDELFLQEGLDILNGFFLRNNTQIQFYKTCELKFIDDDNYLDIIDGEDFDIVEDNFTEGVINVHCVRNYGSAGAFVPGVYKDGIILVQNRVNTSTFAHEVGHYFGLEHTHRNSDKGKCRQEAVSRTRKYALLDCGYKFGLICEKSGDGFCDTPADLDLDDGSHTFGCNFTDNTSEDNWGDLYMSNPPSTNNLMSYMNPRGCRNMFTPSQISAMTDKLIQRHYGHYFDPVERYYFDEYEPDNLPMTARVVPLNTLQHHTFHWSRMDDEEIRTCDVDWLSFQITNASQGKLLQIVTDNGVLVDADTEIWLFDANDLNNSIAYDDDSNGNGFSSIVVENLPIGNYLVRVAYKTDPPFNTAIDYTIQIRECVPDELCVSGIVKSGEIKVYYARNKLTAPCNTENFVVEAGGEVVFVSENEIDLDQGFHVEQGGKFSTVIAPIGEEACYNNELLKSSVFRIKKNEQIESDINSIESEQLSRQDTTSLPESKINLKIYPNPTNGEFTIEFELAEDSEINLAILSLCGKTLKQIHSNKIFSKGVYTERIDKGQLKTGVYLCKLSTKKEIKTDKIIVEE